VYAVSAAQHRYRGQPVPTPRTLLMGLEVAILLAMAAFCSGTCWQPVANLMQGACAAALCFRTRGGSGAPRIHRHTALRGCLPHSLPARAPR
jgi:hypothetical protein